MRLTTPGFGLIALGILLLGAQLVLYAGYKNVHPSPSQASHIEPAHRTTFIPGIFGAGLIIVGLVLRPRSAREADDPRDGQSVPH